MKLTTVLMVCCWQAAASVLHTLKPWAEEVVVADLHEAKKWCLTRKSRICQHGQSSNIQPC